MQVVGLGGRTEVNPRTCVQVPSAPIMYCIILHLLSSHQLDGQWDAGQTIILMHARAGKVDSMAMTDTWSIQ